MKKLVFFCILSLILAVGLFGVISFNGLASAYNEGGGGDTESSDTRMEAMVIMGAGYFLKSYSDFQELLYRVEMAELTGMDDDALRQTLTNVIANMESAGMVYLELKNLAIATPYNTDIIEKLKSFDYVGFIREQKVNGEIFSRVAALLGQGNVTGVCERIQIETGAALNALYALKKNLDNSLSPDIDGLWEINQAYSDALLFGQYSAMVFRAIVR